MSPENVGMVLQEDPGILPSLADPVLAVGEPGAALVDDTLFHGQIEHVPFPGDPLAVEDIEFHLLEGGGHLVLHHLYPGAGTDDIVPLLQGGDLPDIHPDRSIELQGIAAGGGFRVAEHHPDFHPDLVDEDDAAVGLG